MILMENGILLKEIIDYYLHSRDFNGLPLYKMSNYNKEELFKLIDNDLVEVISERDVLNPHIRGFSLNIPKDIQKKNASDTESISCFYPTEKALVGVEIDYRSPYTTSMKKGKGQFDIVYFDIEVLERYLNNPKFLVIDNGYRGSIIVHDEYYDENDDAGYIKDYGMAYIEGEKLVRLVGVFLTDLAQLPSKVQMLWNVYEVENQDVCRIEEGFIKNLLYGEWVTEYWILHAIIDETIVINKQCEAMSIPPLFAKTYGTDFSEMPEGYRNIFLPTMKNYYDFVLVMEKMFVHSISVKTFQIDGILVKKIERKDSNGNPKGSLVMFSEWLNENIRTERNLDEDIIKPLRTIRKIRQIPAHELTTNKYDLTLYEKQRDLVNETYEAIRSIRLYFSNHPQAKKIEVPKYLITGENIVYY